MSYDRDYQRRRDEARRLSEEEGRRIDRELTDKIRKADIAGMRAANQAAQLNREIERRERLEKLESLREKMDQEKASILEQFSKCSSVRADRWHQHFEKIDLTSAGAEVELKNLLEEVEREKKFWGDEPYTPPVKSSGLLEWVKSHFGAQNLLSLAERWQLPKPESAEGPPSLNPIELRLKQKEEELKRLAQQYEEDKAIERELKSSELALIASSLGLLIIYRKEYESVLFNLHKA